jgi:hypothetical protein
MPLAGASATTASVKARRRWVPARCPAAPQLFLEIDDRLGACQAQRQTGIIALEEDQFGCRRIGFGGFATTPGGNQRAVSSGDPLLAPFGEGRGVETFATQDGADPTGIGGAIGIGQDAQLVLDGEGPPARASGQFG